MHFLCFSPSHLFLWFGFIFNIFVLFVQRALYLLVVFSYFFQKTSITFSLHVPFWTWETFPGQCLQMGKIDTKIYVTIIGIFFEHWLSSLLSTKKTIITFTPSPGLKTVAGKTAHLREFFYKFNLFPINTNNVLTDSSINKKKKSLFCPPLTDCLSKSLQ